MGPGLLEGLGLWEVFGETWSVFQGAKAPCGWAADSGKGCVAINECWAGQEDRLTLCVALK